MGSETRASNCNFTKKQKKAEDLQKYFHLEVLNDHKADIICALISIFSSAQWLSCYNIKFKFTHFLDFNHDEDKLQETASLLLKHSQVLYIIGYVEADVILFTYRNVSSSLRKSSRLIM